MNTWVREAGAGARATFAMLVLCVTAPVIGGELDYKLSLGAGHSDNVSRVPTNEVEEDIATAGLKFAFDENTRKVRADVVGDLAYYEYLDDSFESELLGNVYADGMFTLIPERFTWAATDQLARCSPIRSRPQRRRTARASTTFRLGRTSPWVLAHRCACKSARAIR